MATYLKPSPPSRADPAAPACGPLIRRKCACGASAGASGECEACANQARLQTELPPNPAQQKVLDAARRGAAIRTQRAMFKARDIGTENFQETRRLARIKFNCVDSNMDPIGEKIRAGMSGGLVTADIKVTSASAPERGMRDGYVRGHSAPVVLCLGLFKDPTDDEGRIRTLIHEMAHVQGIGNAYLCEQYFPVFDCDSTGAFQSADSWSNYVHCLSGQPPDKAVVIIPSTGPGSRSGSSRGGRNAPRAPNAPKKGANHK